MEVLNEGNRGGKKQNDGEMEGEIRGNCDLGISNKMLKKIQSASAPPQDQYEGGFGPWVEALQHRELVPVLGVGKRRSGGGGSQGCRKVRERRYRKEKGAFWARCTFIRFLYPLFLVILYLKHFLSSRLRFFPLIGAESHPHKMKTPSGWKGRFRRYQIVVNRFRTTGQGL